METEVTQVTELQQQLEDELGVFEVEVVNDENGVTFSNLAAAIQYIEDIMKEYGEDFADSLRARSIDTDKEIELDFDWKVVNLRRDPNA